MRATFIKLVVVAAAVLAVSFAVIVVNQSAQLVELAGRLHPLAGDALFWALAFFYTACLLVPLVLWARLPRSPALPATAEGPEFDRYVDLLGTRLSGNPRLGGRRIATRQEVDGALAELDAQANEIIKQTAARVFLATAVSQNGSLDSLFVLGLQSRLVWDVARVYRQRPSLRDLGWLYANVATTAFVAGEIEELDLSEQIQPVVQNALGAAAGAVPGLQVAGSLIASSIVTGTANAFLTLRVGVVARGYCGAITRPDKRGLRRSAFTEAAGMLGAIATTGARKVIAALAKASGRTVVNTASGIGNKVKNGAGSVSGAVKNSADSVVKTLTFRRKDQES